MADYEQEEGLRDRLSRQGEEALGRLAEELVGNPAINTALSRAFDAREKAVRAQEVAMGAFNIPSAADVERLTRRLRSVSQRLDGIEDLLDRLDSRLDPVLARGAEDRAPAIEARLDEIVRELAGLRREVTAGAGASSKRQASARSDGKARSAGKSGSPSRRKSAGKGRSKSQSSG